MGKLPAPVNEPRFGEARSAQGGTGGLAPECQFDLPDNTFLIDCYASEFLPFGFGDHD